MYEGLRQNEGLKWGVGKQLTDTTRSVDRSTTLTYRVVETEKPQVTPVHLFEPGFVYQLPLRHSGDFKTGLSGESTLVVLSRPK